MTPKNLVDFFFLGIGMGVGAGLVQLVIKGLAG